MVLRLLRGLILLPTKSQPLLARLRWFRLMFAAITLQVLFDYIFDYSTLPTVCSAAMFVFAYLGVRYWYTRPLWGENAKDGRMSDDYVDQRNRGFAFSATKHVERKRKRLLRRLQKADNPYIADLIFQPDDWVGKPDWAPAVHRLAIDLLIPPEKAIRPWPHPDAKKTHRFNFFTCIEHQFYVQSEEEARYALLRVDDIAEEIKKIPHPDSERAIEALEPLRELVRAGRKSNWKRWSGYRTASSDLIGFTGTMCTWETTRGS